MSATILRLGERKDRYVVVRGRCAPSYHLSKWALDLMWHVRSCEPHFALPLFRNKFYYRNETYCSFMTN